MSAAHTPSPWRVSPEHPTIIRQDNRPISDEGVLIGSASGYTNSGFFPSDEEALANAHLIAAAPELLTLLQDALTAFGPHLEGDEWLKFARVAVAKATGKRCCPECGNEDLEREEGTAHCLECGHTWSAT